MKPIHQITIHHKQEGKTYTFDVPEGEYILRNFESKDEKTYLKDLYQENPVKILFPKKLSNEIITAAFVTTSGGIVGGDKLDIIVKTCKKSEVQLYQQAAEKVYKNHKKPSIINISLTSEEGSWLEWLPQETILFENSNYIKKNSIWAVGRASVAEIERKNILQASLLAMKRAIKKLKKKPHLIFIDGDKLPKIKDYHLKACLLYTSDAADE